MAQELPPPTPILAVLDSYIRPVKKLFIVCEVACIAVALRSCLSTANEIVAQASVLKPIATDHLPYIFLIVTKGTDEAPYRLSELEFLSQAPKNRVSEWELDREIASEAEKWDSFTDPSTGICWRVQGSGIYFIPPDQIDLAQAQINEQLQAKDKLSSVHIELSASEGHPDQESVKLTWRDDDLTFLYAYDVSSNAVCPTGYAAVTRAAGYQGLCAGSRVAVPIFLIGTAASAVICLLVILARKRMRSQ
jgi:hypothetical protein